MSSLFQEFVCHLCILPPVWKLLYFFPTKEQVRRESIAFIALSPKKFEATYFAFFFFSVLLMVSVL